MVSGQWSVVSGQWSRGGSEGAGVRHACGGAPPPRTRSAGGAAPAAARAARARSAPCCAATSSAWSLPPWACVAEEEDARERQGLGRGKDSGEGELVTPLVGQRRAAEGGAQPSQPAAKHGFARPRKRGPQPAARGPQPVARGPAVLAPHDRRARFLLSFTVHSTLSFRALAVAWASWSLTAASGATADSW